MKKEFSHTTHFCGSYEINKKKSPHILNISEVKKLISELIDLGYKINIKNSVADIAEYKEVPISSIECSYSPSKILLKGKGLEIFIKEYDAQIPAREVQMGGPYDEGLEGHIKLSETSTSRFDEKCSEIMNLIKKYWPNS
jgi:hypothetical protein